MSSNGVNDATVLEAKNLREDILKLMPNLRIPSQAELTSLTQGKPGRAQLKTLRSFVIAAQAVTALPAYKALRAAATTEKHCVRCHMQYTEDENTSDSCAIPHLFDSESYTYAGSTGCDKIYEYTAKCCKYEVLQEEGAGNENWLNLHDIELCFEGSHTSRSSGVEYNGTNIVKCKLGGDGKCVEKERCDEGGPVFWY